MEYTEYILQAEHFFKFLVHNNDIKQNKSVIKTINITQYSLLEDWANDILDEIIPLNTRQFNELAQSKDFIRKLGRTYVRPNLLAENIDVVKAIANIALNVNEVCNKTSPSPNRRMGKSKETFTSKKYPEYSGSGSGSSDEGGGGINEEEEIWKSTNGSEEEEGIFESDG